jgi:hypothetical protein
MSLAAAVLLGASAFALDNVKVSGDAKLYYGTNNAQFVGNDGELGSGLLSKDGSYADTALRIGITGDLLKGVSFGVTEYAVSTLGLENNLVSGIWSGAHTASLDGSKFGNAVNDMMWTGEAWLATTLGKTTAKLGRMELDTPLAFSEKWSITPNTFEGAVLINQDLPDTTLVGAWIGKGNGASALPGGSLHQATAEFNGVVAQSGTFSTFMSDGAYAAAIVNNSFKPLTAQAWYYNVVNVADAYWLQGDIDCQLVKGVKIGAQYADMSPKGSYNGAPDSKAYAFKLGYEGVPALKVSVAYSKTDKDGVLDVANVATNNNTSQSKLYTEAYWNYGYVGNADTKSWNLTAEYDAKNIAKFGAYYTDASMGAATNAANLGYKGDKDMKEFALTASKDVGPLNATLAYVSTDAKDQNIKTVGANGTRYDTILAMFQLNF